MKRGLGPLLGLLCLLPAGALAKNRAPASEAPRTALHAIVIGYNGAPLGPPGGPALSPLRYADDDAAAMTALLGEVADRTTLLTVMDGETQRRFAGLVAMARAPSIENVRKALQETEARIQLDARENVASEVILFYSGHGHHSPGMAPALTLLDGRLTQAVLYEELLPMLGARRVHVIVDACHAAAVVRPRDLEARIVDLQPVELHDLTMRRTLARFPHVGAIVAAASSSETHEWDVYRQGIFTHELISALRGAGDVDGDQRIDYSEVAAFVAAANSQVEDERARLRPLFKPPALDSRAVVLDLRRARRAGRLFGEAAAFGALYVEDDRGNRLLDVRAEPRHSLTLVLPAGRPLFLRAPNGEAAFELGSGEARALASLRFDRPGVRGRGAASAALARGLFAAPYGPAYYRGFMDRAWDEGIALTATLPETPQRALVAEAPPDTSVRAQSQAWLWRGAAAAAALSATAGFLTWDAYRDARAASYERDAHAAATRYARSATLTWAGAASTVALAGLAWWLGR